MWHWPNQWFLNYGALAHTMVYRLMWHWPQRWSIFVRLWTNVLFVPLVYVLFLSFQVILSSNSWKGFHQFSSIKLCWSPGWMQLWKPTFALLESSWSGVKVDISTCSYLFLLVLFLYIYLIFSSLAPLVPQQTVHSPLFFGEIVEIQRVLPLLAAILIFKCTEGAGVGDYSSRGKGREK